MTSTLSEAASKALLAPYGLRLPVERVVANAAAAGDAGEEVGFPCVAKLCGDQIAHKTERNLVRLGLANRDQVVEAAAELLAAAQPADGLVEVLVAEMVQSNRELIVGAQRSDEYGPVVMVGVGGIFAEVLEDVVFRLLPADDATIDAMFGDLKNQSFLEAFRGEPAVDRTALTAVVSAVGRAMQERDDIVSIDLNPVLISNGEPVAVDALVEIR